ncbi:M1 family metallopeptidase [Chitinophaga horti]|uniref:Aminopeptidase N n=1 Tax=Chitinophaga horti TaxID=2920382 RepID=A0ABY6J174_9BACT|nr:M1 family metallopeptidase [Chitinophaga horti]UYQ93428.1 M1 family metallopeptidase [Chitinophaga horti]
MHRTSKLLCLLMAGITASGVFQGARAQSAANENENPALKIYRATPTKINNLVHTKLDVRFDYAKRYLNGKAWITLRPHFYATDSLLLDAKGMDIKTVAISKAGKNTPLKYDYDGWQLNINLDKLYKSTESYVIYIEYTAKPDELTVKGSSAITDAKGLYFINPDGKDPDKPVQIWTQGETEASSVWFPTIDKNNQKTTSEIAMTVPKKYVTLSNGKLVSQKPNTDGTRTDTWKMDQPHAPYLFMMAVGDFVITKDAPWKGKEVSYYQEKAYAPYAKAIFGHTPEMMTFYSNLLGVDYPWVKYSQVVVRDYVSGAMENTTATLHGEMVQKTDRELLDDNHLAESVIAHELFHQWFGDYATCESWSNLTLNESFADYSEYLWLEHKYGKDAADAHHLESLQNYFNFIGYAGDRDLVRFHYRDKEDMFDAVSYQKGGRILHMLRNYVGDDAFFKSLNLYLKNNAFKATESHHLRLAFEEVTGKDLNWFWNQWYFGQGYPELDFSYDYNDATKKVKVTVKQQQKGDKIFTMPFAIDVYEGGKKTRHNVILDERVDSFFLPYSSKPDFVNVDGDKILLAKTTDHRDINTYIFQYKNALNYQDRREAISATLKQQTSNAAARAVVVAAMKDKYEGLRAMAVGGVKLDNSDVKTAALETVVSLAKADPASVVRATAIGQLAKLKDGQYAPLFEAALKDKSYAVAGAALNALNTLNPENAYATAKSLEPAAKGALMNAISAVYTKKADPADIAFFDKQFATAGGQNAKFNAALQYLAMLSKVQDNAAFTKGIDAVKGFADQMNNGMVNNYFINLMQPIVKTKQEQASSATGAKAEELKQQAAYTEKVIAELRAAKTEE